MTHERFKRPYYAVAAAGFSWGMAAILVEQRQNLAIAVLDALAWIIQFELSVTFWRLFFEKRSR